MPGYKGHLVGGAVTFGVALYAMQSAGVVFTHVQAAQWFISALAGCLFPDVDVKSKGQNILYKLLLVLLIVLLAYGYHRPFMVVSIAAMVPMIVRHRGLFHRLWFVIGFPAVLSILLVSYYPAYESTIYYNALFFVLGAISHLWLDLGIKKMFIA